MPVPGLTHFMLVSAALFCIGLFCLSAERSAVKLLLGLQFMFGACFLTLASLGRFLPCLDGMAAAVLISAAAAAELGAGAALMISAVKNSRQSDNSVPAPGSPAAETGASQAEISDSAVQERSGKQ